MLCLLIRLNNLDNKFTTGNDKSIAQIWLNIDLSFLGEFLSSRAHHNVQYISEVDVSTSELTPSYSNNADSIQALITLRNKQQKILNLEKFGPLTQSTVLITVQVHNRFSYLAKLIESLKAARNISSALVIFSHDVFSQEANQMIQEIDFCMVMQIFYPYSIQTHPLTFPGDDPKDCPRDILRSEAERINCRNYDHPGMFPRGSFSETHQIEFILEMKTNWWTPFNHRHVRSLPRGEIYANEAPLVVEAQQNFRSAEGHKAPQRISAFTWRRLLRCRRFYSRAETHAE